MTKEYTKCPLNGTICPFNNGWPEWSNYVLKELEHQNKRNDLIFNKLDIITAELITLKVKAGVWGAMAGSVPVVIGLIIAYLALK